MKISLSRKKADTGLNWDYIKERKKGLTHHYPQKMTPKNIKAIRWLMKRGIKYRDEPIDFAVIDDFLPPPEKLILKEETAKVTITLTKESVDFFKKYAKKQRSPYQRMIRRVLDYYVTHYRRT